VVGVNGYDESREQIEEYMAKHSLRFPVLLTGGALAREKYFVSGYPTRFWIDHEGVIVARQSGFDPAEAAADEARIAALLAARNGSDR